MRISDWSSDVCSSDLLGQGLGRLSGKVFRIGHLGDFNDLSLCGTLAGVEMGLAAARVPHQRGGLDRKSVVEGKSVSVRVDLGGRRIIKKKKNMTTMHDITAPPHTNKTDD